MLSLFNDISIVCAGLFAISIWSGIVAYIIHIRDTHEKASCALLISQIFVSCFTGILGGLLALDNHLSIPITFSIAGISGTLGIALLKALQKKLLSIIQRYTPKES
ncbi:MULTISPECIES: phage holin family protein [Pseudomonas]|uniref:phage holin family protein n=1 Tax=Pseudomonas TaxID=286 RepID=UPI000B360951|nr:MULTISPECIES: phage holin family protein [Pseudomonas]PMY33055.1 holin [Pseudomonas sp. GW456-L14]PMY50023.1 holin [Pseudomonas sp. GW456-L12]PMY64835.1 holin [Pseudomonas sp. FW305-25]PMY69245.1 holin [Pseudomonas sp. FW126-L8]PNA80066.1 holin [Pseudomonas sp. FW305-76]